MSSASAMQSVISTPAAERKPTTAFVGYCKTLNEPNRKDGGTYHSMKLELEGIHGSRNYNCWLVFKPEWFDPQFSAQSLSPANGGAKGDEFVFKKNIANRDNQVTTLQALLGSDENFTAFMTSRTEWPEYTAEQVYTALRQFLADQGAQIFGYIVKQEQVKTGNQVEGKNGKIYDEKIHGPNMNVDSFFYAQGDAGTRRVKGLLSLAAKARDEAADKGGKPNFVVGFDVSSYDLVPF